MMMKGETNNALSLMFQHEGFTSLLVMDAQRNRLLASSARYFENLAVKRRL